MICCVTGHRPKGFPFPYEEMSMQKEHYKDELKRNVQQLIQEGYTQFISGMAQGVDMDFAETVLYYRKSLPKLRETIKLEAASPFPQQKIPSANNKQDRYRKILFECDTKTIVCPNYQKDCFQLRNQYMVDKADLVLAVWNGIKKGGTWNTIHYAQKCGKPIRYIMLNDIQE